MQGLSRRLDNARLVLDPVDRLRFERSQPAPLPPLLPPEPPLEYSRRWSRLSPGPRPRPFGPFTLTLLSRRTTAGDSMPLATQLQLSAVRSPEGYLVIFDRVRVSQDDQPRRSELPAGDYELEAVVPAFAPLRQTVTWSGPAGATSAVALPFEPGPAYPFERLGDPLPTRVNGALETADSTPLDPRTRRRITLVLADAVDAPVGPPGRLNAQGGFLLLVETPGAGPLTLRLRLENAAEHVLATDLSPPQGGVLALPNLQLPQI